MNLRLAPLLTLLAALPFASMSQAYMEEITNQTCACLKMIPDTITTERYTMELGVCMLTAATPHKKQLKKDFGIDLDQMDTDGEELGRMVGVRMASTCPELILTFANRLEESDMMDEESVLEGIITDVEAGQFVTLAIKDEAVRVTKVIWLTYVDANVEMTGSYESLMGKAVRVTYMSQELFDPRIDEYRDFNVLLTLEQL